MRSHGHRSWTRPRTGGGACHMRGGGAEIKRLCALRGAQTRGSLRALPVRCARTQLCRDARAHLARHPPPRVRSAAPDTTREPAPPALVPACAAACAQAGACAMRRARWRGAPSPPTRMWAPAREPRAYGAPQGGGRGRHSKGRKVWEVDYLRRSRRFLPKK